MPTVESELVEVEAELKEESEKFYRIFDGRRTVIVPRSIVEMSESERVFTMPEWLAREKGLI